MTVTFTTLTTGSDTTNQTTPYTTASITPTANQPVLAAVYFTVGSGSTPAPVISGCGLTWSLVVTNVAGARTVSLYLGIGGSPTTGTLSIAGDGTTTTTSCLWQIVQTAGVDITTANGVVQSKQSKNTGTSTTSTSVAFDSTVGTGNGAYGAVGTSVQENPTAGTGWTAAGTTNQTAPTSGFIGEYASTAQQNVSASWTTAASSFVVGVELKASGGGSSFTGSIALSGSGAVSGTGTPGLLATADMAGGSSLDGSGTPAISSTSGLSGGSTLTFAAGVPASDILSLGSAGGLSLSGAAYRKICRGVLAQRYVPLSPPLVALMNYSKAILRINGEWVEAEFPAEQQINAADIYIPGGYETLVDDATADLLIAAGYTVEQPPLPVSQDLTAHVDTAHVDQAVVG